MKKGILFISSLVLLALAGCNKESNVVPDPSASGELAVLPMNGGSASRITKGYVEESKFVETYYSSLHKADKDQAPRTMQLSAYLTPQNGEAKNYFVDKTYSKSTSSETTWWNTDIVGGDHDPIYWPVGGTLDFLAYSVSSEETGAGKSQNIKAVWDNTNAAQKVTLTVPGENTQNDILFASAYGEKSRNTGSPVNMTFNHAQAWLEFILTGSVTDASAPEGANKPIVNVKRIELENVYNAGTLNITNNGGNAIAKWDFSDEVKQNIAVDNFNENLKLTGSPKYLDMLIPQQTKTAFVIYYTLGSDTKELSYRFTTDQKTWLMGEKYIYKINITTSEVTVAPVVTIWNGPVQGFEYTVNYKSNYDSMGTVTADIFGGTNNGDGTISIDTWGAQVKLTATPTAPAVFVKWSDDVTENPRTFTVTESVNLPEAVFGYEITTKTSEADASRCTETTYKVVAGESATITAAPAKDGYKFFKWCKDTDCLDYRTEGEDTDAGITVDGDKIFIASVNAKQTFYAKYIPIDAIPGAFSVSADKKVFFSKGNLYANVTFGTGEQSGVAQEITSYAFESDQTFFRNWNNGVEADKYANVGKEDKAYFGSGMTTTPAGTVGAFYWTDHAVEAVSKVYKDVDAADSGNTFFAASLEVSGHFWSCLSNDEWSYLLKTRDGNRIVKANVNGITGLLIFPDGYTVTYSGTGIGTVNNRMSSEDFPTDPIDSSTWSSMEASGVVFLPASGFRDVSSVNNVGSSGHSWSTTPLDKDRAFDASFFKSHVNASYGNRGRGTSVRLVSE